MLIFALEKSISAMENITKIRKFPLWNDVVAMLLLFFVPQFVIGVILQLCGVGSPVATSVLDPNSAENIEIFMREQEILGNYNAWVYPLMMLSSIVALWCYVCFRGGKGIIRIHHAAAGFNPNVILVGVLWLISAQIILEPLIALLPQSQSADVGLGAWACFTAVISAPILEEVLCRGVLFETMRNRWGVKGAILFSSLFFGLIHLDLATAVVATVAGVILGVLYVRTSSIYASMIVHSINNAMAFTMINFENENTSFSEVVGGGTAYYILYGVAFLIFAAASVEAYFKIFRPKTSESNS